MLDRVTSVTEPDENTTTTNYSISDGLLKTLVTDAMRGTQATFTNGSDLTRRTEQYSGPDGTITTRFEYDAINQPIYVIDTKNDTTASLYDLAGRRTQVTHPASGTTKFGYDLAGNLISKQTANLLKVNQAISYEYTYNRLKSIHYPQHPENDVTYTYGGPTEAGAANGNQAGRIKYLTDGSGVQEFKYGRMGEITENRRTLVIPNQAVATYVTNWTYDSWNRVRTMTYPDGEVLTYSYDYGGQLARLTGTKGGYNYTYINTINYDHFGQRSLVEYGNITENRYSYDNISRNLSSLSVLSIQPNATLMENSYSYDDVDNVVGVINSAPIPSSGIGGQMTHNYQYDGLYRLKSASGSYTGRTGKTASYTLAMGYDNLHSITRKKQEIQQNNIQFTGNLLAGYSLGYTYNSTGQQINTIADTSYRTTGTIANTVRQQNYRYDANGNLLRVNTSQRETDSRLRTTNLRRMLWDEENRMLSVSDNGYVSNYWYDASGERTVKISGEGEGVLVNGIVSGGRTGTTRYTAYVSPYVVISNGGQMSKHIYIGSQRVLSKLCSSGSMGEVTKNPQTITPAGGSTALCAAKYATLTSGVKTRYDSLDVPYHGTDKAGVGFWTYSSTVNETSQYYYHPDHLGSSSLITNLAGEPVQHIEYVPFGEVLIDERQTSSTWATPYKFNAKELDEETGLYYYGARYMDPRTSIWLSVDPLWEKKPWMSSYVYCSNNPMNRIDPDGRNDYELECETGNLKLIKETEANTHTIYASNGQGVVDMKNSIEVSRDFISSETTGQSGENIYTSFNDEQAQRFYNFAADNSKVEWSIVNASYTDNSGTINYNLVTTSHEYGADYSIDGILNQMEKANIAGPITQGGTYQINEFDHSHTNGSMRASGSLVNGRITGDLGVAKRINSINGNDNALFNIRVNGNDIPFSPNQTPNSLNTPVELKGVEISAPRKP